MIGHAPDYTHHTSDDTPDMVDPVELERAEIMATATTVYLASLSESEALDLVGVVGANSLQRLASASRTARRHVADESVAEAGNAVAHVAEWERQTVESVLRFHDTPSVRDAVASWNSRLTDLESSIVSDLALDSAPQSQADDRIPVRLTRGPLDFGLPASGLEPEAAAWYASPEFRLSGNARFELVNFIDGERTVTGIRNALSAQFGPISTADVSRYLEDLVEVGVIEWGEAE
jgi:hypothetical protein